MRNDQLFAVLENIDERYIDEAENYKTHKKNSVLIRYIGLAAAAVLIFGTAGLIMFFNSRSSAVGDIPWQEETNPETAAGAGTDVQATDFSNVTPTGANDTLDNQIERLTGVPENKDLMGLGDFRIDVETNKSSGMKRLLFVLCEDESIIAECSRCRGPFGEGEAYSLTDIDGDGVFELVCNQQYATGAERVAIFRNNNGTVEYGLIREEYIREKLGISQLNLPSQLVEIYDSEIDLIRVTLIENEGEEKVIEISLDEADAFEYLPYEFLE
ncbi:MAG: hypothetical protein IKE92_04440 [Clostridiales bacterium]|nr:hypothetical protein [Clostridiales bacterium]